MFSKLGDYSFQKRTSGGPWARDLAISPHNGPWIDEPDGCLMQGGMPDSGGRATRRLERLKVGAVGVASAESTPRTPNTRSAAEGRAAPRRRRLAVSPSLVGKRRHRGYSCIRWLGRVLSRVTRLAWNSWARL